MICRDSVADRKRERVRKKDVLVLAGIIFLLSSCVGIKSTVTFNKNGGGSIVFEYRISKMLIEMGGEDSEIPLPISEEDFRFAVAENTALKLNRVSQREDDEDLYITADVAFEKIEDLTGLDEFGAMPMKLERTRGNEVTFTQIISEGFPSGGDDDGESMDEMMASMMAMFEGYELAFTVKTPAPVTYHNLGELSSNRRSVTYSISFVEIISLSEQTVLIVRWGS